MLKAAHDKPIIVYCSGGDCHDSRLVANALLSLGFGNVSVFTGGWMHGRPRGCRRRRRANDNGFRQFALLSVLAVSLAVAAIFIYAGIDKIHEPLQFADSIAAFGILPAVFINLLALRCRHSRSHAASCCSGPGPGE